MSTAVKISSNALVEIGLQPINSFTETTRGEAALDLWPQVRDGVLRSHPWNCAIKRAVLSPNTSAPAFGWGNAFDLPGDCVRVLSIDEGGEETDFAVEGGKILCNESVVYLRYVYRNENPATYDATLFRCMTLAMAAALAMPLRADSAIKQEKERELLAMLRTARAVDGQEQPAESIRSFPLLAARF